MKKYRYILEPYSGTQSRYTCPECKRENQFTKYIDTETNEYLDDNVGRCNREDKCAYHYTPNEYFLENDFKEEKTTQKAKRTKNFPKPIKSSTPSFIDFEIMKNSFLYKGTNNFVEFLKSRFDKDSVTNVVDRYNIGTSNLWNGATIFWQVDINGGVRTGRIMLYNAHTCKRIKEPFNHISWMHKRLKLNDFNLKQCLFGEHLINEDAEKPIAIVESDKTAIISSIYFPEFIWLATGNSNNINAENTKVLTGRNVVLFPDLNCFDKWKNKIPELNPLTNFEVSTLLEDRASDSEKEEGLDLADYLLQIN